MISNLIIILFWVIVFTIVFGKSSLEWLALQTTNSRLRWLRKLYWNKAKDKIIDGIYEYKVRSYFRQYLDKSIATKEYFLNHGLHSTKFILIGKLEELERFVEKYRYNTFDNLDDNENDFIDEYMNKNKPKK